ncbi:MAG: hypothetical protein JWM10_4298 [Myxococcaceae bacterium]|nr:hypothetical protein [Myxococcaceae bacterium]
MKTLALALALSLVPALAAAQTPPSRTAPPTQRVVRVGEYVSIVGVVPRPYYWYQSRSALHYQPPVAQRAFAPTVVRAVRTAPF